MPRLQSAQVAVHDFGAPVALGTVAVFAARKGGELDLVFENPEGVADATVSVETSLDNVTYAATTVAKHGVAITSVVIKQKTKKNFTISLRQGLDLFVRVRALGGTRLQMQHRGDVGLDIVQL